MFLSSSSSSSFSCWSCFRLVLYVVVVVGTLSCSLFSVPRIQGQPLPYPVSVGVNPNMAGITNASDWNIQAPYAFVGDCLTEAQGHVANFSFPLYTKPIWIGVNLNAISWYLAYILQILITEVIGYQVYFYDLNPDWYQITEVAEFSKIDAGEVDLMFTSVTTNYPVEYDEYVTQKQTVLDLGAFGSDQVPRLYISTATLLKYPQFTWEWFRSYQQDAQGAEMIALLRNVTWENTLNNPTYGNLLLINQSDPTSFACQSDSVLESEPRQYYPNPYQGCVNGMYVPPQCQENPQRDCAVIYNMSPGFIPGMLQNLVKVNKLNFTVAYMNLGAYQYTVADLLARGQDTIYLFFEPSPLASSLCSDPALNGGLPFPCNTAIEFPPYDPTCLDNWDGTAINGTYNCDFQPIVNSKLVSATLPQRAPRVYTLSKRFQFFSGYFNDIFIQAGSSANNYIFDYRRESCNWVQSNLAIWQPFIAAPEECTFNDFEYTVSQCDESTSLVQVTYQWILPRACQAGVALPSTDYVACDYIPAHSSTGKGFLAAAIFLVLLIGASLVNLFYSSIVRKQLRPNSTFSSLPSWIPISFHIGLLCLITPVLVNAAINEVSEIGCQVKVAFVLVAFALVQGSVAIESVRVQQSHRRLLISGDDTRNKLMVPLCGWIVVTVVLVVVASQLSSNRLQQSYSSVLASGASVPTNYCALPTLWLLLVVLLVNVLLFGLTLSRLIPMYFRILEDPVRQRKWKLCCELFVLVGFLNFSVQLVFWILAFSSGINQNNADLTKFQNIVLILGTCFIFAYYIVRSLQITTGLSPKKNKKNNNETKNNDKHQQNKNKRDNRVHPVVVKKQHQPQQPAEDNANGSNQAGDDYPSSEFSIEHSTSNTNTTNSRTTRSGGNSVLIDIHNEEGLTLHDIWNHPLFQHKYAMFGGTIYVGESIAFLIEYGRYLRQLRSKLLSRSEIVAALKYLRNKYINTPVAVAGAGANGTATGQQPQQPFNRNSNVNSQPQQQHEVNNSHELFDVYRIIEMQENDDQYANFVRINISEQYRLEINNSIQKLEAQLDQAITVDKNNDQNNASSINSDNNNIDKNASNDNHPDPSNDQNINNKNINNNNGLGGLDSKNLNIPNNKNINNNSNLIADASFKEQARRVFQQTYNEIFDMLQTQTISRFIRSKWCTEANERREWLDAIKSFSVDELHSIVEEIQVEENKRKSKAASSKLLQNTSAVKYFAPY